MFIYLAYPILIVPSSLPAINAILIEEAIPPDPLADELDYPADQSANSGLNQLTIKQIGAEPLSFTQKVDAILDLHRQGMEMILGQ